MAGRDPKGVIEELFRRGLGRDDGAIDELVAENMVNHAAGGVDDLRGPQGRAGWKQIVDGVVVEHWACRDDLGLLFQVGVSLSTQGATG